jgi:hypothetical protein
MWSWSSPNGCLNEAPCPPFTIHGASIKYDSRLGGDRGRGGQCGFIGTGCGAGGNGVHEKFGWVGVGDRLVAYDLQLDPAGSGGAGRHRHLQQVSSVAIPRHGMVSQNGWLLSRRGRSLPANARGFDIHRDSMSRRSDCRWSSTSRW